MHELIKLRSIFKQNLILSTKADKRPESGKLDTKLSSDSDTKLSNEFDERKNSGELDIYQSSLRSIIPQKLIITSANLRLGEVVGQGNEILVD